MDSGGWERRLDKTTPENRKRIEDLIAETKSRFDCDSSGPRKEWYYLIRDDNCKQFAAIMCSKNRADICFRIDPDSFASGDSRIVRDKRWFFSEGREGRIDISPGNRALIMECLDHAYGMPGHGRQRSKKKKTPSSRTTIAVAVWIATAALHRKRREDRAFAAREIADTVMQQGLCGSNIDSIRTNISKHCVANRKTSTSSDHRKIFLVSEGRYRLYKPGDEFHPNRARCREAPTEDELPEEHKGLRRWYDEEYVTGSSIGGGAAQPTTKRAGGGRYPKQYEPADLQKIPIPKTEDLRNEFKELRLDEGYVKTKNEPVNPQAVRVVKAICCFGNSYDGGFVFIGMHDSGSVVGLEKDDDNYTKYGPEKYKDKFANYITSTLNKLRVSPTFRTSCARNRAFRRVDGKTIYIIQILPSDSPVYLHEKRDLFMVRENGPRCTSLEGDAADKYRRKRFPDWWKGGL